MSNPTVRIPMDVLAWWYRKAKENVEHYDPAAEQYPGLSEIHKRQRAEGHKMAIKTIDALKGLFEKDIICETEDTNHE